MSPSIPVLPNAALLVPASDPSYRPALLLSLCLFEMTAIKSKAHLFILLLGLLLQLLVHHLTIQIHFHCLKVKVWHYQTRQYLAQWNLQGSLQVWSKMGLTTLRSSYLALFWAQLISQLSWMPCLQICMRMRTSQEDRMLWRVLSL